VIYVHFEMVELSTVPQPVLQTIGGFVEKLSRLFLFFCCAVLLLSSCSQIGEGGSQQVKAPLKPLSCIAVLPASGSVGKEETVDYEQAQSLEKGAYFVTDVIKGELKGYPKVRILNSSQVASLVPEISGGISGTVSALGQKLKCDGVLLTTIRRFQQREGSEYAADSPASVDLSMILVNSQSGNVLWSAEIREKQKSFLENIFSFTKAKKRGFKWVSVEQLTEQGIKERLSECPYLK
jgi:hypothetical protein